MEASYLVQEMEVLDVFVPKNKFNKIEQIFKNKVIKNIKFDNKGSHIIYS